MNEISIDMTEAEINSVLNYKKATFNTTTFRVSEEAAAGIEKEAYYFETSISKVVQGRVNRHIKRQFGLLNKAEEDERADIKKWMWLATHSPLGSLLVNYLQLNSN
jgi:hypothetical protein